MEVAGELSTRLVETVERSLDDGGAWKTLLQADARAVLATTELASTVDAVLDAMWRRYAELEATVPLQPSLGAVFTTHLAAATLALHEALLEYGLTSDASYEVIYEIGWRIYAKMAVPPALLARALTRDPLKRMQLATDIFRFFPFGAPGYTWRDAPAAANVVAFDCTRCPVAEFFASHDASELCVRTFCKLDFPLAERWGGRLVRTGTISAGASHCDFRWHVEPPSLVQLRTGAKPRGPR